MEIDKIFNILGVPVSTGLILLVLSLIKIPKIEVNLWQILGKAISQGLTKDIITELSTIKGDLNKLNAKVTNHIEKYKEEAILASRQRILRFSDELAQGQKHSLESFTDILSEIDRYEDYCIDHPHFPNNKCVLACENIKNIYKERLEKNDFLYIKKLKNVKDEDN